ncbi:Panacea domain-containing protein [Corynebacterium variabile]|uniref:Panacea domain-containing protein n=1 Tax=Corynebacterium variabile TaxID=1727 RepID=UPI003FD5219C
MASYIMLQLAGGRRLDTVKLQKLVYYCQGWTLARDHAPLYNNSIENWKFGPVVPDLYRTHAGEISLPSNFQFPPGMGDLTPAQRSTIDFVVANYGGINTFKLANMTHRTGEPWHRVTNDEHNPGLGHVIGQDIIEEFFRNELERVQNGGPVVV